MLTLIVTANLQNLVKKGSLTIEKMNKALPLLTGVLDYSEFKNVDMVIEVTLPTPKFVFGLEYCNQVEILF